MKQFIKLTYNSGTYSRDINKWVIVEDYSSEGIFRLDSIVKISCKPQTMPYFDKLDEYKRYGTTDNTIEVFLVKTSIPIGQGINGVDFDSFFVDRETHEKFVKAISENIY